MMTNNRRSGACLQQALDEVVDMAVVGADNSESDHWGSALGVA